MPTIGGIIVPIITPLTSDQQVDVQALAGLCERQVRAGTNVIFALGTTGEFYALTHEQRRQVVDVIVQTVDGKIPVIVGISGDSTAARWLITASAARVPWPAMSPARPIFQLYAR